jgi:5'-nucleotidase
MRREIASRAAVALAAAAIACGAAPRGDALSGIAAPPPSPPGPAPGAPVAEDRCTPPRDHGEDTLALRAQAAQVLAFGDLGAGDTVEVKLLGFNDFHGQLGAGKTVEGRPVGGAAVLASYLKTAAGGGLERALVVHAGDLVGASPPASALFKDEPTIAFLGLLANAHCKGPKRAEERCNVVAGLGNHEIDEGIDEALRIARGGNHASGPFLGVDYAGPRFPFVTANVIDAATGDALFPASAVVKIAGARIGVVGATVRRAKRYLPPRGTTNVRFEDEAEKINTEVAALKARGVRAIVVSLHEGGEQDFAAPAGSPSVSGRIVDIVAALDPEVDVVVSGHTHTFINAAMTAREGKRVLVTQASSAGTAFSDTTLRISAATGDVVSVSSTIVTAFADEGPGLAPDPAVAKLVARVEAAVSGKVDSVVGEAAAELPLQPACSGESALGDLVADAQREAAGAQIALVTPAWLRAGIDAGPVTWGELFTVQPFGNRVVTVRLSGATLLRILESQWTDPDKLRVLNVSGIRYVWDPDAPPGHRVHDVRVGDAPLDPTAGYTTAVSDFLADGGDNLPALSECPRIAEGPLDVEALAEHIRRNGRRLEPALDGRIERRRGAAQGR